MVSTHSGDIALAMSAPVGGRHGHDDMARLKAKDQLIHNAKAATDKEQSMTLMQGIRLYPKVILWSVLISTCIVMEGYDVCLINNFCVFFHPLNQWHSRCPKTRSLSARVLTEPQKMPSLSSIANMVKCSPAVTGKSPPRGSPASAT